MSRRKVRILASARAEVHEAFRWYEKEEKGLGERFRSAVRNPLDRINSNPFRFPAVEGSHVRRALVEKFPFATFFSVEDEQIVVAAIFHTSREPEDWSERR